VVNLADSTVFTSTLLEDEGGENFGPSLINRYGRHGQCADYKGRGPT
jgi:hypothetical protein